MQRALARSSSLSISALKRIGIACGDTVTATAAPRPAAACRRPARTGRAIEREVRALQPHLLVVGAPYNADGSPGALRERASGFAAELERRFGLPVKRVDERWSSLQANERAQGRSARAASAGGGCGRKTSTAPPPP